MKKSSQGVNKTLSERGLRYGDFEGNAEISQAFKSVLFTSLAKREKTLPPVLNEALEMILHKIARVVNGDELYHDNFHDIAGYASLAEKWLLSLEKAPAKCLSSQQAPAQPR